MGFTLPTALHMNKSVFLAATIATLAMTGCQPAPSADATPNHLAAATKAPSDAELVARGEYLVRTAGCNDCHTPDYGPRQGEVPTSEWLVGSPLGFKGPWGTTYASNLRLRMAEMDETQWLDYSAKLKTRPIMPDFAVRAMTADDRRAIYRFVRSLGPAGQPAPAFVPPDQAAQPPYFELVMPGPPAGAPSAAAAPATPTTAGQG